MYRRIVLLLLVAQAIAAGSNCSRTTTGFKPLNAPFFTNYHSFAGGLYPGNSNRRPVDHESGGRTQAASVRPRDTAGNPNDTNGKIVLLSIGMSNTTQEFSAFQSLAGRDPDKSPNVVLVDGAQGGWSADRIVADPTTYWNGVEQRIVMSSVSDTQVQAAWVKLADAMPTLPFPDDARKLQSETQQIIQMARSRFPNLRLVYLSSRIYAGYADTNLNPEPYAYEGGFAVKWLIEAQINGSPDLDYTSGKFPWLAWGPYVWADGVTPRTDGLAWTCADLQSDGTHPSASGQMKVARMLLDFFKSDTTARPWFVAAASQIAALPKPSAVLNAAGFFATIAPGGIASPCRTCGRVCRVHTLVNAFFRGRDMFFSSPDVEDTAPQFFDNFIFKAPWSICGAAAGFPAGSSGLNVQGETGSKAGCRQDCLPHNSSRPAKKRGISSTGLPAVSP
jgi:hypothetical protein